LRTLMAEERPLWSKMTFSTAQENFFGCARLGMDAAIYWPGLGVTGAEELLLRKLLPMAHQGLEDAGVSKEVRERYLGIVEARAKSGRNGASWQVETVTALEERGLDRAAALTQMLKLYTEGMHANEPVHTWPVP
jgi:hypothetical protein